MVFSPGFEDPFHNRKVCKSNKSLYGLKQSLRASFERFVEFLRAYEYFQSQANHTLFLKHSPRMKITVFIIYVDEIIVTNANVGKSKA